MPRAQSPQGAKGRSFAFVVSELRTLFSWKSGRKRPRCPGRFLLVAPTGSDNEHPSCGLSEQQSCPIVLLGRHVMPPVWGSLMAPDASVRCLPWGALSSPFVSARLRCSRPPKRCAPRSRSLAPSPPFRTDCLRALAHGSGRSTPSRAASPARRGRHPRPACPLDRVLCAPLPHGEGIAETVRERSSF